MDLLAERGGFEPPVPFRAQRFSRPPQSTTLPPLRFLRPPAQLLKKSLQELAGALFLESAFDVEAVIQARVLDEVPERAAEAGLRVVGSEDQPLDAGVPPRPGAHRARLEGHDHRRSFEPPVADRAGCFTDGDQLRVSEGVAGLAAVAPAS